MALTAEEYIQRIAGEIPSRDDTEPDGTVQVYNRLSEAEEVYLRTLVWPSYSHFAGVDPYLDEDGPYLQYLYARRAVILRQQARVWQDVTNEMADVQQALTDMSKNLAGLLEQVTTEIESRVMQGNATAGARVGHTHHEVLGPLYPGQPDPNWTTYRGDPRRSRLWGW